MIGWRACGSARSQLRTHLRKVSGNSDGLHPLGAVCVHLKFEADHKSYIFLTKEIVWKIMRKQAKWRLRIVGT
jgi:hypothetical protein